jgi:tRNA-dihydrouridine synthase B
MIERDRMRETIPDRLRIGELEISPPILQAPMAGFTNYAYRQMVRDFGGVGLQFTEMVSAKGLAWMDDHDQCPDRLWGVLDEPRPLGVQIWDNDPETMARVAERLARHFRFSVIDVNFGCPARQVAEKARSGSYLLNDPDQIGRIIERVVQAAAPTPVTAKIRLGRTRRNITASRVAQAVESAGAAALTVHGRAAEDFFRGTADWREIARIKSSLRRIPLIGNGDIQSPMDVVRALRQYDVDGVMIGRAAMGQPWIFAHAQAVLRGDEIPAPPCMEEQRATLLHHFELIVDRFGAEKGTMLMRKYACCYAQGRRGARQFRSYAARVGTPDEFRQVVHQYFPVDEPRETDQFHHQPSA